jgi:hypothetical protein
LRPLPKMNHARLVSTCQLSCSEQIIEIELCAMAHGMWFLAGARHLIMNWCGVINSEISLPHNATTFGIPNASSCILANKINEPPWHTAFVDLRQTVLKYYEQTAWIRISRLVYI